MDQFVVLATTFDHVKADTACSTLETSGIPVMLEHIEINSEGSLASGIRLLVPASRVQLASSLVQPLLNSSSLSNAA